MEKAVPSLRERRMDASTTLATEPAVRAAERAILTETPTVLADTLMISVAAESRRRLDHVLDLKGRAERDPARREAYQRAANELRSWAAGVYLASLRGPPAPTPPPVDRSQRSSRMPVIKHRNPHTEESISTRRLVSRLPFPGQRKRHPLQTENPSDEEGADSHSQSAAQSGIRAGI